MKKFGRDYKILFMHKKNVKLKSQSNVLFQIIEIPNTIDIDSTKFSFHGFPGCVQTSEI